MDPSRGADVDSTGRAAAATTTEVVGATLAVAAGQAPGAAPRAPGGTGVRGRAPPASAVAAPGDHIAVDDDPRCVEDDGAPAAATATTVVGQGVGARARAACCRDPGRGRDRDGRAGIEVQRTTAAAPGATVGIAAVAAPRAAQQLDDLAGAGRGSARASKVAAAAAPLRCIASAAATSLVGAGSTCSASARACAVDARLLPAVSPPGAAKVALCVGIDRPSHLDGAGREQQEGPATSQAEPARLLDLQARDHDNAGLASCDQRDTRRHSLHVRQDAGLGAQGDGAIGNDDGRERGIVEVRAPRGCELGRFHARRARHARHVCIPSLVVEVGICVQVRVRVAVRATDSILAVRRRTQGSARKALQSGDNVGPPRQNDLLAPFGHQGAARGDGARREPPTAWRKTRCELGRGLLGAKPGLLLHRPFSAPAAEHLGVDQHSFASVLLRRKPNLPARLLRSVAGADAAEQARNDEPESSVIPTLQHSLSQSITQLLPASRSHLRVDTWEQENRRGRTFHWIRKEPGAHPFGAPTDHRRRLAATRSRRRLTR